MLKDCLHSSWEAHTHTHKIKERRERILTNREIVRDVERENLSTKFLRSLAYDFVFFSISSIPADLEIDSADQKMGNMFLEN